MYLIGSIEAMEEDDGAPVLANVGSTIEIFVKRPSRPWLALIRLIIICSWPDLGQGWGLCCWESMSVKSVCFQVHGIRTFSAHIWHSASLFSLPQKRTAYVSFCFLSIILYPQENFQSS